MYKNYKNISIEDLKNITWENSKRTINKYWVVCGISEDGEPQELLIGLSEFSKIGVFPEVHGNLLLLDPRTYIKEVLSKLQKIIQTHVIKNGYITEFVISKTILNNIIISRGYPLSLAEYRVDIGKGVTFREDQELSNFIEEICIN